MRTRITKITGTKLVAIVTLCGGLGSPCGLAGEQGRAPIVDVQRPRTGQDIASPVRSIHDFATSPNTRKADVVPARIDTSTPIDLSSALRLAGVQNLQMVLAQQRVEAAVAIQQLAAAQLLPSLNLGTNYDAHTGVLQQPSGNILTVDRGALYVGAGASAVGSGTVTIPGLQYNVNIAQGIYGYLVARQRTNQRFYERQAVDNGVLLSVARSYAELLRAEANRSLAILARNDAREIARLTAAYAKTGEGRPADAERAATELLRREQDVTDAEARVVRASNRLVELLNLDPTLRLHTFEAQAVPEPIVPMQIPLPELLATALVQRPELQSRRHAIAAALAELDAAKVLPFSPTVLAGLSGGAFGGGSDLAAQAGQPRFGDFGGRTDVDVVLFWSLRNLGVGNKAMIDAARARLRGSQFDELIVLDQVREEVADAYARAHARLAEIARRSQAVRSGLNALREDMVRVRGREGLPIELIDSLRQLASSRREYVDAIIGFNVAQLDLYVALGGPPADMLARPVPADLLEQGSAPTAPK